MISFHPDQSNLYNPKCYHRGFVAVDTDDPHRIAKATSSYVISLQQFQNGYRHSSSFIGSNWIGLDFEDGPSIEQITKTFCDIKHVVGTSRNHQRQKGDKPPSDRFHIFLQLPHPILDAADYKSILTWYINAYDADKACKDVARFFWPCREITSICDDGDFLDLKRAKEQDPIERFRKKQRRRHDNGSLSFNTRYALLNDIPIGQRHITFLKAANELARAGVSFEDATDRIISSPTFTHAREEDLNNVEKVVKSAYKYVLGCA